MELLHATRYQCKARLSPSFMQELPFMIRAIEGEWRCQIPRGAYPSRQRFCLQQAHIALAQLLDLYQEVSKP
jgi:hypothetical protein